MRYAAGKTHVCHASLLSGSWRGQVALCGWHFGAVRAEAIEFVKDALASDGCRRCWARAARLSLTCGGQAVAWDVTQCAVPRSRRCKPEGMQREGTLRGALAEPSAWPACSVPAGSKDQWEGLGEAAASQTGAAALPGPVGAAEVTDAPSVSEGSGDSSSASASSSPTLGCSENEEGT